MSKIDRNKGLIKTKSILFISVYLFYNPDPVKNNIQLEYYNNKNLRSKTKTQYRL